MTSDILNHRAHDDGKASIWSLWSREPSSAGSGCGCGHLGLLDQPIERIKRRLSDIVAVRLEMDTVRVRPCGRFEEPWTQRWTSDVRDCVVVAAYRPNYFGFRAVLADALHMLQKRRRNRLAREVKKGLRLPT